ncbi:hypothetical protein VTK56DRAFT_3027 [Thermocarpiscus australiensis]
MAHVFPRNRMIFKSPFAVAISRTLVRPAGRGRARGRDGKLKAPDPESTTIYLWLSPSRTEDGATWLGRAGGNTLYIRPNNDSSEGTSRSRPAPVSRLRLVIHTTPFTILTLTVLDTAWHAVGEWAAHNLTISSHRCNLPAAPFFACGVENGACLLDGHSERRRCRPRLSTGSSSF